MVSYNLDSNIFSAYLKGSELIKTKVLQESLCNEISISAIVYYEIKRGLLNKKEYKYKRFLGLIKSFNIILYEELNIFDIASEIAQYFPMINNNYRDDDILIAALCISKNMCLVSNDSDFDNVPDLKRENW